jgi:all-trans-retinol 13,14-reductase
MKVAVIGAGAAGLYSALLLSRYGYKVTLLEAGNAAAPLLRGFTRAGLQCDTGFHMAGTLREGGALYNYLNFAGLLKHLRLVPHRQDCCTLLRFAASEDVCIPQGTQNIIRTLSALYPNYRKNISDFLSDMEAVYQQFAFINPLAISADGFGFKNSKSLRSYFDGLKLPPKLRTLLTFYSIYYGVPPARGLFAEFALIARSMQHDVHSFEGGGLSVAAAFEHELGGTDCLMKLGFKAKAVRTSSQGSVAAVVSEEGEEIPCDFCIYTGHPSRLPELLPAGALRPAMRKYLAQLEETHKFFMVFAATKSSFLSGRDAVLCATDDLNDAYAGAEPPWLHLACGTAGKDGYYPLFVGVNVEKAAGSALRQTDYPAWKKTVTSAVLAQVAGCMPELAELTLLDSASERSLEKWIGGSRGSAYGVMHSEDNMPVMPFTRVRGLLLAGQSILLPGLLGTFVSATVACGSLIGYKRLLRDLAWKSVA